MLRLFTILISLLLTTSCASDLFSSKKEKLPGERREILTDESIKIDNTQNHPITKINLPKAGPNQAWANSHGYNFNNSPTNLEIVIDKPKQILSLPFSSRYIDIEFASPIFANNKSYIIQHDGNIIAYDMGDQKKLWDINPFSKKHTNKIGGGISYQDGKLFATNGALEVVSLNAETGELVWIVEIDAISRSAPLVSGNKVFVQTSDNRLLAIDKTTGHILWTHQDIDEELGLLGASTPILYQNLVVVPYSSGSIAGLDKDTGETLWMLNIGNIKKTKYSMLALNDIDIPMIIQKDTLYLTTNTGLIFAFSLTDGSILWNAEIHDYSKSMWVSGNLAVVASDDGHIYAYDATSGGKRWVISLNDYITDQKNEKVAAILNIMVANSNIAVFIDNGSWLEISPQDGSIKAEHDFDTQLTPYLPVIAYNKKLYAVSRKGNLFTM